MNKSKKKAATESLVAATMRSVSAAIREEKVRELERRIERFVGQLEDWRTRHDGITSPLVLSRVTIQFLPKQRCEIQWNQSPNIRLIPTREPVSEVDWDAIFAAAPPTPVKELLERLHANGDKPLDTSTVKYGDFNAANRWLQNKLLPMSIRQIKSKRMWLWGDIEIKLCHLKVVQKRTK